jgi:hypothetical protein
MILFSYVRVLIRTSACVAVSLAASAAFAADDAPQPAQAQLLDQAKYLCTNCFFGTTRYYYCFEADKQILVGYQKTRVLNWEDNTKNYLTSVNPGWEAWTPSGQTVSIRYNEKHIWVTRADGGRAPHGFLARLVGGISGSERKPVRLNRSSLRDIFINNDLCRGLDVAKTR